MTSQLSTTTWSTTAFSINKKTRISLESTFKIFSYLRCTCNLHHMTDILIQILAADVVFLEPF